MLRILKNVDKFCGSWKTSAWAALGGPKPPSWLSQAIWALSRNIGLARPIDRLGSPVFGSGPGRWCQGTPNFAQRVALGSLSIRAFSQNVALGSLSIGDVFQNVALGSPSIRAFVQRVALGRHSIRAPLCSPSQVALGSHSIREPFCSLSSILYRLVVHGLTGLIYNYLSYHFIYLHPLTPYLDT